MLKFVFKFIRTSKIAKESLMKRSLFRRLLLASALIISGGSFAAQSSADEGMWLYNNLPLETLDKKYGFKPTAEWADHLMKSSVRFNSGGSGSFVSSNGLVLTNHHVASDVLFKLSTADKNLLEQGFLAKTNAVDFDRRCDRTHQLGCERWDEPSGCF
jgi:S1-C subfamily serine protease